MCMREPGGRASQADSSRAACEWRHSNRFSIAGISRRAPTAAMSVGGSACRRCQELLTLGPAVDVHDASHGQRVPLPRLPVLRSSKRGGGKRLVTKYAV